MGKRRIHSTNSNLQDYRIDDKCQGNVRYAATKKPNSEGHCARRGAPPERFGCEGCGGANHWLRAAGSALTLRISKETGCRPMAASGFATQ